MKKTALTISLGLTLLAGCSVTAPVAAISENGQIMRGQATATLESGSFYVSDGKVRCGGNYDPLDMSETIPLSILCNDGRTGIGSATRTADGASGSGQFSMNDGSQWRFVFGAAAKMI